MTSEIKTSAVGLLMTGLLLTGGCGGPEPTALDEPRSGAQADQRTDTALTTQIRARFYGDDAIRGRNIDVKVTDGAVVLEGTVDDEQARQQATTLAQAVEGVTNVDNRLEVAAEQTAASMEQASGEAATETRQAAREAAQTTESAAESAAQEVNAAWITTKIQSQYFVDDQVKGLAIDVNTTDTGVVTLEGDVASDAVRTRAAEIARNTEGVRRVDNQLRVEQAATNESARSETGDREAAPATARPMTADASDLADDTVTDAWITMKIQSKYFLDGDVAGRRIDVSTQNGTVTLKGEVQSDAERRQALALARTTDGVQSVNDQLTLAAASAQRADRDRQGAERDRSTGQIIDDTWVTTKIQSKYFLDEDVKGRDVDVKARNGVVTLTGTVATEEARKTAEAIAMETDGVERVENQLKVEAGSGSTAAADEEPADPGDMPRD